MGHRVTTLNVNTIEPAGNTLTIGASGDSVVIGNNDIRANTYKDAGGNTLFVSDGSGNLSSINSGFGDALKLLSTQAVTNQASVSFASGIDSTYKEYVFKFYNINPATDVGDFVFQANAVGETGYNETITSIMWRARNEESGSGPAAEKVTSSDQSQAQGTEFQQLCQGIGSGADENAAGELHIFNPASTTYVKNFYSTIQEYDYRNSSRIYRTGGIFNITGAIDDVQFKMKSGNFDGTIKMFGIK